MEDSYTVHRRRKAAARRREKTPDPPRRHQEDVASDEEEEARSRMERLVQETERLEELEESERRRVEADKSSGDHADPSVAEKLPRSLKRAMSPDVTRRIDDQTHNEDDPSESKVESVKAALPASVPPTSSSSTFDKTNSDNETRTVEKTKKVIDAHVQSRVAEQSKESVVKVTRKTVKKEDAAAADVTPTRVARRRTDVDKDLLSERVTEKPARSLKKALSPDPEKIEEKRTVGESRRRRRTSPSRDQEEERQAAALDKNRYEVSSATAAAAVTRESDAGAAKFVISERAEHVKKQDLDRDEDVHEKSRRPVEDSVMVKKRDVTTTTLPSKSRSSESRGASATKRSGKERNVERSGYTTDSSETEETDKRILKRTKSPEVAKTRSTSSRKTASGKSRANTDTDGDVGDVAEDLERRRKTERRRSANRRRGSSETDDEDIGLSRQRTRSPSHSVLERREAVPPVAARQGAEKSETVDDDFKMVRRSGTFPIDPPRDTSPSIVRSISETKKKQIIPLSDDILIEDFERAQREYLRKERGILDRDPLDDYVDPKMEAALRRRKFSIARTESEVERAEGEVKKSTPTKRSWWFGWRLPFFGRKVETEKVAETKIDEEAKILVKEEIPGPKKVSILEFFRTLADFLSEFRAFVEQNPRETRTIRILRNRCIAELLLAIIYCGLGAFVFRFTEGAFETFYKCGVKRVKRDFLDSLWNFSHNMREEDWKSMARRKLMEFEEQLHTAHEAGVHSYSGQKSWSFLNSVVYCLTVITTIGYGHISPSTTTGRAITIVYAIFGIPMFLIILADFGKLFTRGIKFLWAFVRRVYYTGSCRRVRRTVPVQEVMKGVQLVYDLATFRRPSQMNPEEIEEMQKQQNQTQTVLNLDGNASASIPGTPGTPAMSTFAIDDEFNLPISVAIIILLVYIFVGATVYNFWEQWGFFESFYFVFISMSTIGFGDYVPKHPMYMMLSIVYLVFGLALTSMCINVVQVMLSDSFKQASQKIGATIGFEVAEEDGSIQPAVPPPVELADVHATIKESESKEQVAPKAKQEDVEL